MVASSLFAFVVLAQQAPEKVTVKIPALGAPAAIEMLATHTGQSLKAGKGLEDEVIIIDVKDVPYQDVLDRIAKVTKAKWEDSGSSLTLVPDTAVRKAAKEQLIQASVAKMDKQLKEMENPKPLSEDWFKDYEDEKAKQDAIKYYQQEQETQKMMAQLMRNIGLRNLATLPVNQRVVYSDQPTQAQKKLNGPWAKFATLVKEQFSGMEGMEDYDPLEMMGSEGMPPEALEMMRIQAAYMKMRQVFNGNPVKFLLIINRYSADTPGEDTPVSISGQLMALDDKGGMQYAAAFGGGMVAEAMEMSTPSAEGTTGGEGGSAQVPEDNSTRLAFSPEELALFANDYSGMPLADEARMRILKTFTNPAADPLDAWAGIVLRRWAEAEKVNLIASVPDQLASLRWMASTANYGIQSESPQQAVPGTTVNALREGLKYYPIEFETKDGWLTVSPLDNDAANSVRLGRASASQLATALSATQVAPLDVRAAFAYDNPNSDSNDLAGILNMLSIQGQSMFGYEPPAILRLWGSLSAAQKSQLKSQGRLAMNSLSPRSRDVLSDAIYNIRHSLTLNPPAELNNLPQEVKFMMGMGGGYGWDMSSWMTEPTEAFPRGIPFDGFITLQGMKETCFIPVGSPDQNNTFMPVIGATELMMLDVWRSMPAEQMGDWVPTLPSKAKIAQRTSMSLTLQITPQVQMTGPLIDLAVDESRGEVFIANPPEDIKKEMEAARSRMKTLEGWMKYMMGMYEGDRPVRKP